ncbi:carbohydrate-Binding Module family 21 protein [Sclerotinia borealis F-4128]|uniref:Carbohydrate-Binding Module family 21 protein n=1 Tax=Sclerotinia borealis (strain F-4128) TaxID=1432307 RepID=W9CIZ3_SCLBF|nr:carbohydrate-Binding Module family 21 protein [Sclerotinia borealis F-4128]
MPYTPPSQRSPANSSSHSPAISRRSSYQQSHQTPTPRPELPRSTSYLTRHRRTPSVKSTTFATALEPTPPGTADGEKGHDTNSSLTASSSLRQSPPPVTDETKMPVGVVMSPPDSTQNSDEEDSGSRGRKLENLEELHAAIRIIEQHRENSPIRTTSEIEKLTQAISVLPISKDTKDTKDKSMMEHMESSQPPPGPPLRKIQHTRSSTETVFLDLRSSQSHQSAPETPTTGSDDELSDGEAEMARRKPPMLRKKSGELVRPALRPSSARRRPSSMPGTPTFSKAVHFDSHLEHVRHFLQVDRPLAVSAGSSPVEAYESDSEFPFGNDDDDSNNRGPPFEWEIVISNFPAMTAQRAVMPIRVERVFLSADNKNLIGTVAVANLAFNKLVIARFTLDYWKTTSEVVAEYNNDIRQPKHTDGCDRFNFNIKLADQANLEAKTMFFCVKYYVNGLEYWDNNNSTNFQIDFRKKAKPQSGKRGSSGAASKSANSLPRSNKKSPPTASMKKSATFDDFSNDFDSKYLSTNFKLPVADYLGESNIVRLKGVKSAVTLASDNRSRRATMNTNAAGGQAFGHRYDFGASLNAAISAANSSLGDKSGITMKSKNLALESEPRKIINRDEQVSPLSMSAPMTFDKSSPTKTLPTVNTTTSGTDSPRPVGTEKPVLASQSYNELLDKYCFFGSVKNSPQLKDGTARPGQFDGNNDDGYSFGSSDSTASNSPTTMTHMDTRPSFQSPEVSPQGTRSTSPAPMTGFVSGTSPMYPYHTHGGFSFNDTHPATAIRG